LEGEGRLDFDHGPLADSGVFAITGPNGSGKTSILDVITLALYGETFRFDKPAEHIITKHTDESFAQVEFAFAGQNYRSSWQAKRNLANQPEMQLQSLEDEQPILASTPNQVRSYLSTLTGLDFHKFCKSIILPQGDFSAFLNALDSERLDILEKISGEQFYSDYRQQLSTKQGDLKSKLSELQHEIAVTPLLSDEALQAAEQDLEDFQLNCMEMAEEEQQLQVKLQSLQSINLLEKQYAELEEKKQQLLAESADRQKKLQRIAEAGSLEPCREEIQVLKNLQSKQQEAENGIKQLKSELALLQSQLNIDHKGALARPPSDAPSLERQKQTLDMLKIKLSEEKLEIPRLKDMEKNLNQQLTLKKTNLTEVRQWLEEKHSDAILVEDFPEIAQLRNLRAELQSMSGKQKNLRKLSKKTTAEISKSKNALTQNQTILDNLKNQIEVQQKTLMSLAPGISFEELKELATNQEIRCKDFQDLLTIANTHARLTPKKKFFGWFSKQPLIEELPDLAKLQARVATLREEMGKADNISKALEQAIINESLLKRLASQRLKLIEGKPCFLCGSTQHPYTNKPPQIGDSKRALADHRAKHQQLKTTLLNAEKQLEAANKTCTRFDAKQRFLTEKRSQWSGLVNKLNIVQHGLNIENISLQERILLNETKELQRIKSVVAEHAQLQRNIARAKNEIEERQALIGKLRLQHNQLDSNWADRSPEFEEMEKHFRQCEIDEKALTVRLEKQLISLGEKMPSKGKENALFDRLNGRRQDYQIQQLRSKGLQEEIADLEIQLDACRIEIGKYEQALQLTHTALQKEELLTLQIAIVEKQNLLLSFEQSTKSELLALETFKQGLAEKITGLGFASLQEALDLFNLVDSRSEIMAQADQNNAELQTIDRKLLELNKQIQLKHPSEVRFSESELKSMHKLLTEKQDIATSEVERLQTILQRQYQYRDKHHALETTIQQLNMEFASVEAELQQVNGDPLRSRAKIRQLLIDKLLSSANQVLEQISGRYYLRSSASEHGLALEIEDSKQNHARRLPKTLSGGESFVVSLALALALAEITNNGKTSESLFLDEGFGYLDAESLYMAMTALESLTIQGKTVGVISHVDGVKKRIKTQVELVKKANGLSELRMVA
jgi:DNA repair protein SbcC/Rad50